MVISWDFMGFSGIHGISDHYIFWMNYNDLSE
jgi:hypothetical protein